MKKGLISIYVASILATSSFGLDLKDTISEALSTNPTVQERLKNFREVQQDLKIAQAEWSPSLDFNSTYGYNDSTIGNLSDSYSQYTNSLRISQNLFNGFSTTNNIGFQKSRVLVAAHNYVENANSIAFQVVQAYINVIRGYKLYQNAYDNVKINESIYEDVKTLFEGGLTTKSEMTNIFASLSLAKSNLLVSENNAKELQLRLKRLVGREIDVASLSMPQLNIPLPADLERAITFAIENNPSIIVGKNNLESSKYLYNQAKSGFYPTVNASIEQSYDRNSSNNAIFGQDEDRLTAMVTLSWNLFRGGADVASVQKGRSTIGKEVETLNNLKRQLVEGLELSWTNYGLISDQLVELYAYNQYSQDTLDSYLSEYELGRRTLLDLLSAQQNLNNSKAEIINAQLDKLFAQYRILDGMGLLVKTVLGDDAKYNEVVNPTLNPFVIQKDELPIKLDADNDGVVDGLDICDNSTSGNVSPFGCAVKEKDIDFDGIADRLDRCPNTPIGDQVDGEGCSVNGAENKFEIDKAQYITPVAAYNGNSPTKSKTQSVYDYSYNANPSENVRPSELDNILANEKFDSIVRFDSISANRINQENISIIANEINNASSNAYKVYVTIIGNKKGYEDALNDAERIKNLLVQQGISGDMLFAQSRGNKDPLYYTTSGKDSELNDRVDIAIYVQSTEKVTPVVVNKVEKEEPVQRIQRTEYIINFNVNSSFFQKNSMQKLNEIKKYLDRNQQFNAVLTGHSSKDFAAANPQYDKEMSIKRANRVKDYLISNGISSERIQVIGKGHEAPLYSNDTKEGRERNRRVEVKLTAN